MQMKLVACSTGLDERTEGEKKEEIWKRSSDFCSSIEHNKRRYYFVLLPRSVFYGIAEPDVA